ncbi:hypothetical protein BASA50_006863 [Batrachochytrium salamandrivorans]|uniref:Uncharacterized protein n=1 Tax=Batrachochytrium salamandrivorans TaxID=1357716 RepID=A0ABQ8FBZ9_9FUNG|nr:hypothetical protein BASA50_006863 [Batrachochytrium salamandrivorans]KAH9245786.1 hypothetical protein BASA81_016702 [Batrachochytrium salamandrivorans]
MKLSSFFVGAMVIISANAGLLGEPEEEDINFQITEQSVASPDSDSMSVVQKQMEDYPVISYLFNGDKEHDDLLKNMFKIQTKLFSVMGQSKAESRKNVGPTGIKEHPIQTTVEDDSIKKELTENFGSSKVSFGEVRDLRSKIYVCLDKFEEFELRYISEYGSLPENSPIPSFKELKEIAKKIKQNLKLNRYRYKSRSYQIQKS